MSRIRIKHFGPIREGNQVEDGWLDIKKVTVFIGNQGSGKSTVAKLISTFTWMEKALVRGDYDSKWFERKNKLKNHFLSYHRLESYFQREAITAAVIEYDGEAYAIKYEKGGLSISEKPHAAYALPQIMYVPAERNFISYVRTPRELKLSSDSLKEFLTEFDNAKNELKESVKLPLNEAAAVEYDKLNDVVNVKGAHYKVKLPDASSGFQSLVPLYLVTRYLAASVQAQQQADAREPMSSEEQSRFRKGVADIWRNDNLSDEQKQLALSALSARFNKTAFINIVEEPEQNLFPLSQWAMLRSLLEANNLSAGNKLVITTHSPFIINYLSIAIQAHSLHEKIVQAKRHLLLPKLNDILPTEAMVADDDVVVYQLNESDGSIKRLATYEGIPTDQNYLNDTLRKGNHLFDALLALEEEL
ncbi:MAG: AAA family ATPase [Janthinobacterium lividum]